jgi:hypothetical protein
VRLLEKDLTKLRPTVTVGAIGSFSAKTCRVKYTSLLDRCSTCNCFGYCVSLQGPPGQDAVDSSTSGNSAPALLLAFPCVPPSLPEHSWTPPTATRHRAGGLHLGAQEETSQTKTS